MSIENFKAALNGGIRLNRFEVVLPFPAFAAQGDEASKGRFLAIATSTPNSTLGVIEVPYQGRTSKHAGDRTFEPWTVTFKSDAAHELKDAFERWSNAINNHETNGGLENPNDYIVDAEVHQLNTNGDIIKTYTMKGIWPSEVGQVQLSADSSDQLEEFEVTFEVLYWTSNSTL